MASSTKLLDPETVRTLMLHNTAALPRISRARGRGMSNAGRIIAPLSSPPVRPTTPSGNHSELARLLAFDIEELMSHTKNIQRRRQQHEPRLHVSMILAT